MKFQDLYNILDSEFEQVIIDMFATYGYDVRVAEHAHIHPTVKQSKSYIPLAPYHLIIRKDNETAIVKYKCWSVMREVDLQDVMSLSYNMENVGANIAYYITLGGFSDRARLDHKEYRVILVDANDLEAMLIETGQIEKPDKPTWKKMN